jgi:nucleotide-binding universal stress UspA family protein
MLFVTYCSSIYSVKLSQLIRKRIAKAVYEQEGGVNSKMYKKILVPLDGSTRAEAILPHAQQMAVHFDSEIIFLQVLELSHMVNLAKTDEDSYRALPHISEEEMRERVIEAQRYLSEIVKMAGETKIVSRFRITYGPIASSIINIAVEEEVDLIAMASHGCSGLQGVYYGSVAAGVLQRVDRPLLIVRSQEE